MVIGEVKVSKAELPVSNLNPVDGADITDVKND